MLKGILTAMLSRQIREQGFTLEESEDFVELYKDGKIFKVFSSHGAKIESIEKEIKEAN